MRKMAGKVIRAKLPFGIESFLLQIICPLFQLLPIKFSETYVAFHFGHGREKAEEITTFLDWHLIIYAAFTITVNLSIGFRIGAKIVWRERKFPALARSVVHEWNDKCLGKRRAEQ